jgi:hypothetical protein
MKIQLHFKNYKLEFYTFSKILRVLMVGNQLGAGFFSCYAMELAFAITLCSTKSQCFRALFLMNLLY